MSIGGGEFVILFIMGALFIVPLALGILVAIDASKYPESAFERAGTSKTLWIVLPLVSIIVCGVGTIIAAIVWYASYKPRVVAAAAGGSTATP